MNNQKSPSRALRPMSLHFGAASSFNGAAYFDRKERRLFNAKMEKRRRQNELDQEELDRSLEEQRARLDSIGALLDHALMFVNEHPTPETSPWKKTGKFSTPTSSPTSEPISPVTVIKVQQTSSFARKPSLRRPLFPKVSNNNSNKLPLPKPKIPPKPSHLTMAPMFSSTPDEVKKTIKTPKVTDL
ncbi:unnamed protein product [Oikopleura dioica]|uniref:Uncharacterized protein n=1 Tax=Oikopleura dioica TaxID=34765 RepID=E4XZ09_OIKDI|nr:unnamed protein product [Oikopleura dioica]